MDEFDLEETHLATAPPSAPSQPRRRWRTALGTRRRLLGGIFALCALVLALAVILFSSPGPSAMMRALLHLPTPGPTATLPPGANTFLIEHGVPWGDLLANGTTMVSAGATQQTLASLGEFVPSFALPPGTYTLVYHAPPFPDRRCRVSVPVARSDTCPLVHPAAPGDPLSGLTRARILDLGDTLDHLSPTLNAALLAETQRALAAQSSSRLVAPGEPYLRADGSIAVATQTLVADFVYTLNRDPARLLPGFSQMCVSVCAGAAGNPIAVGFTAEVRPGWHFATQSGQVLVPYAPLAANGAAPDAQDLAIAIDVNWTGRWEIAVTNVALPNPTCQVLTDLLDPLLGVPAGSPLAAFSTAAPVDGCAYDSVANFSGPDGRYLYQFGVLLAANDAAHQRLPQLPMADAAQQALAAQMAV